MVKMWTHQLNIPTKSKKQKHTSNLPFFVCSHHDDNTKWKRDITNATLTKNWKGKGFTLISWKVKGFTLHHWKSKMEKIENLVAKPEREREREGDSISTFTFFCAPTMMIDKRRDWGLFIYYEGKSNLTHDPHLNKLKRKRICFPSFEIESTLELKSMITNNFNQKWQKFSHLMAKTREYKHVFLFLWSHHDDRQKERD